MNARAARLFLALWPDEAVRTRVAEAATRVLPAGFGRRVPSENLHVTLRFLGSVGGEARSCIVAEAAQVRGTPFSLTIDCAGRWSRAGIAWLGMAGCPAPLAGLVRSLEAAAVRCGLEPERRTFTPHVTVARRMMRPLRRVDIEPIEWPVGSFALVASEARAPGRHYRCLEAWELQDPVR